MVEKKEFSKVAAAFSPFLAELRIRIWISDWILAQSGQWIRIQEGKNDPQQ
jgi:hypothetical protein